MIGGASYTVSRNVDFALTGTRPILKNKVWFTLSAGSGVASSTISSASNTFLAGHIEKGTRGTVCTVSFL